MNEADFNRRFYEVIGGMELDVDGVKDYETVTDQAMSLQALLDSHLTSFGDIDRYNELAQGALMDSLSLYVESHFLTLDSLSSDDEIVVTGEPELYFKISDRTEFDPTSRPSKLHGLVQAPVLKILPISLRNDRQVGVFFPIKQPAIELLESGDTSIVQLPEGVEVLLSLASGKPVIKRRLDGRL